MYRVGDKVGSEEMEREVRQVQKRMTTQRPVKNSMSKTTCKCYLMLLWPNGIRTAFRSQVVVLLNLASTISFG